jgi:probable addiction module antidote protein
VSENEFPSTKGSFKDFLVKYKTGVPGMVKPASCTMRLTNTRVEFIKRGKVQGAVKLADISGANVYKESELIAAIGVVAKAIEKSKIAEETGLSRPSLYKALSTGVKPQFATIMKVLKAVGGQIQVTPTTS